MKQSILSRYGTWVLMFAVVAAATVLAVMAYRTTFQMENLRSQAIVETTLHLADEKVDRIEHALIEAEDSIMALGEARNPEAIPYMWRASLLRPTPTVSRVMVIDGSGRDHSVVAFASRNPGPDDETFRSFFVDKMLPDLEINQLPLLELKHLHKVYGGKYSLIAFWRATLVNSLGHRFFRWVIVCHDSEAIVRALRELTELDTNLPNARLHVVDDEGHIIAGPSFAKSDLLISRRFPTTLYGYQLQVWPLASKALAEKAANQRIVELGLLGLLLIVVLAGVAVLLLATWQERRLNSLRSEFVANVSHELKTPLSLIRMFGEMLMTGRVASDEKRKQYIGIIVRESERLTALIENVLDFARVERLGTALDFAEADIGTTVSRAVDACRYRAETEKIALELVVEPNLPPAKIDERAVQLAVINLVENALKYAPTTKIVIISVARTRSIGKQAAFEIAVTDEGEGVNPDDRERVFERFYRGKSARQTHVRGSGIGLSLVRNLAEDHGGVAYVRRSPTGKWSTFVVQLPFDRSKLRSKNPE